MVSIIQYRQIQMKSEKIALLIALILLSLFFPSEQTEIQFQRFQVYQPMPNIIALTSIGDLVTMKIAVYGAISYRHISDSYFHYERAQVNKEDSSKYRDDNYTFVSTDSNNKRSIVYVTEATGLVRVYMAMFKNGIKVIQKFALTSQFSKGFNFMQLRTDIQCRVTLTRGFSFFSSKQDALKDNLEILPARSIVELPSAGTYYIRMSFDPSSPITSSTLFYSQVRILTLQDSKCSNPCMKNQTSLIMSSFLGKRNYCKCSSTRFYNPISQQCAQCNVNPNSRECSQITFPVCGDGIVDTYEQCDNQNQTGCSNHCTIDEGYQCTNNQTFFSLCKRAQKINCGNGITQGTQECDNGKSAGCLNCLIQPGYSCSQDEKKFSTCQNNSHKIIIGVCVGVGSAAIIGLSIFFLVKYLKAKTAVVELAQNSSTKVNINNGNSNEAKRQPESFSKIEV